LNKGILNKLSEFTEDEKIAFKKKAVIFSFFLILSIAFWFMNALSKTYSAIIDYPVRYTDIPAGKVLVGDTPDYLTLRVTTHGYRILRHKLSSRYLPIAFSVNSFALRNFPDSDTNVFYIQTRFAREHLSSQMSSEINIQEISPDTLYLRFASVVTKKLPVISNVESEPDRQMIFKDVARTDPDSVLVSGPDYIIDTLQGISTKQKNLGILSKSFEGNIDLQEPEHVSVKHDKVKLSIGIERITEKNLLVPLNIINLPDTIKLKTFPSLIEVNCNVGLSNFPRVQAELFRLVADFNDIEKGEGRLPVSLVKSPEFVRSVSYNPKSVEYLIEK
jgi:hypothetical protein